MVEPCFHSRCSGPATDLTATCLKSWLLSFALRRAPWYVAKYPVLKRRLPNEGIASREGRLCFLICEHYNASVSQVGVMDLADLISVGLRDDSHLQTFWDNWDTVLCGMIGEPSQSDLEVLVICQLRE